MLVPGNLSLKRRIKLHSNVRKFISLKIRRFEDLNGQKFFNSQTKRDFKIQWITSVLHPPYSALFKSIKLKTIRQSCTYIGKKERSVTEASRQPIR